jgi:uncharacterized protein YdeI (YjbR/CyaY-like superfamily)
MNPKIDEYINSASNWQEEMRFLRKIALECNLEEELKWGVPCYTFNKKNIILIHAFKDFCGFGFFKGALLKDEEGILSKPGENSNSSRISKVTSTQEIKDKEALLKAYLFEAIEIEKAELKVKVKEVSEYSVPEELIEQFDKSSEFKIAFDKLTPGRQKAYLLHFSEAKQSSTRTSRIEKYIPRILNGKGFNDCVCGLSKRMPSCDGSHKQLSKN